MHEIGFEFCQAGHTLQKNFHNLQILVEKVWLYSHFRILQNDHLKKFEIVTKFPSAFQKHEIGAGDADEVIEESDSDDSLPENTNRRVVEIETSSDESSGVEGFR